MTDDHHDGRDASERRHGIPWAPPYPAPPVRAQVPVSVWVLVAIAGAACLAGGIAWMSAMFAPATDGINEPYGVVIALPLVLVGAVLLCLSVGFIAARVLHRG